MIRKQSVLLKKSCNFEVYWKIVADRNLSVLKTLFILFLAFAQMFVFHFLGFYQFYGKPDPIFSFIVDKCWYINMLNIRTLSTVLFMIVRGVAFGITVIYLISYIILYCGEKFNRQFKLATQMMRFLYTYYNFILLFPCLQIFLFDLLCNSTVLTSLHETCRQGGHLLFWIMGFIGLAAAIFMTILKHWYSMNSRFDKKNAFAGENKKFEIIFTVIKFFLAFLTALEYQSMDFKRLYVAMIFVLSLIFVVAFIYYMPYTKKMVEYFCFTWIVLFFAENFTMVVYLIAAETEDWYISIHFVIYFIVMFPTLLFLYFKRQDYLLYNKKVKSTAELIRQTYLYLKFNQASSILSKDEILFRGIMEDHVNNCNNVSCFCKQHELYDPKKGKYISFENRYEHRSVSLKFLVRTILENRIRMHPKDADLLLLYAEFLFNKFRNTHLALYQIMKISELGRHLSPTSKYKLFKLFHTISEYIHTRNEEAMDKYLEIENAIWVEEQFGTVLDYMKRVIQTALGFWGHLHSKEIDLNVLNEKAQNLIGIVDQTTGMWAPLKPYLDKQKKMKYFYNWYLKDFLNKKLFLSEEDLENILEEDNVSVHSSDFINSLKNDNVIFQEDSCIVQISGNAASMGKILKTNKAIEQVFGYQKTELEGALVNSLMPSLIAQNHQKYMEDFVDTGRSSLLYNQKLTYAKHKKGYIFPVWIIVKQLSDAKGEVQYVGLLRPMRVSKEEESHYLLLDDLGEIQGMSKRLCHDLQIDPVFASQSNLNILMLAPKLIKWMAFSKLAGSDNLCLPRREHQSDTLQLENGISNNSDAFARLKSIDSHPQSRRDSASGSPVINPIAKLAQFAAKNYRDSGLARLASNIQRKQDEITWDELIELDKEDFNQENHDHKAAQDDEESDKIVEFTLRIPKKLSRFLKEFEEEKNRFSNKLPNKRIFHYPSVVHADSRKESLKNGEAENTSRIFAKSHAKKQSSNLQMLNFSKSPFAGGVTNLEGYIHSLKKISHQVITTPKEKNIFSVKATIKADYYGHSRDPIICLKILSIQNHREEEELTLDQQESEMQKSKKNNYEGSVNSQSQYQRSLTRNASYFKTNKTHNEEKKEESENNDSLPTLNRDNRDVESKKIHLKDDELQELVSKKSEAESMNRRIAELKAAVMTYSSNLFEKEENFQCHKHLQSLTRVKWFMRILFLAVIPINIIIYLIGANQTLQNLVRTVDEVYVNQIVLQNYNQIQDSVITLLMLNKGTYDSVITPDAKSVLADLKMNNLRESVSLLKQRNYDDSWMKVLYSEMRNNQLSLLANNTETLIFGDEYDGVQFSYDEVIRDIFNAAERLALLHLDNMTDTETTVQFFNENVKKLVTAKLEDVIDYEISMLEGKMSSSQNLSIGMLIFEVCIFGISFLIIFRLILNVTNCFKVILEVFTFIDDQKIKETLNYYRRLGTNLRETLGMHFNFDDNTSTISKSSKKSKAVSDRKQQNYDHRIQKKIKGITENGLLNITRRQVLVFYVLSVLVCSSFTISFQLVSSGLLRKLQNLLSDGQQYFSTATNIPDMMMSLKQWYHNDTNYQLYLYPYIQPLITELSNVSSVVPLKDNGYDFETVYNQLMFNDGCSYFQSQLSSENVTNFDSCKTAALGKLSGGIVSFKEYLKVKTLPNLQMQTEQHIDEVTAPLIYDLDMAVEVLKVIINQLLEIWKSEAQGSISWTNRLLIGVIIAVSISNFLVFIISENLVVGTLRKKFLFYRELYNRNMLTDALIQEKRIKALLVKAKVLQK